MSKHRTTSPSLYYERQSPAQAPIVLAHHKTRMSDGEYFVVIIGAAISAFIFGMLITAGVMGVL